MAFKSVAKKFVQRASAGSGNLAAAISFAAVAYEMRGEAQAVKAGLRATREGRVDAIVTAIRRDIHRVEKGLIMRPRRVPFGAEYIPSLVASLSESDAADYLGTSEREWAAGVLREYFVITRECEDEWVRSAADQFESLELSTPTTVRKPTERSALEKSDVTVDQLASLAKQRRSVRWFTAAPVDHAIVDRAIAIAGEAPSACNRQNFTFKLVYGQAETERVLRSVGGTNGFAHQVPAVAVLVGRLSGYRHTFDRHAIYVDGGLAAMGFILALEAQGLSSCCINWPDQQHRYQTLRKSVPIAPDEQVIMLIAIGEPDPSGGVPVSVKRSVNSLRSKVER